MYRILHQDLELIPILGQQLEFEPVRNRRHVPRFGYRLEAAHHQAADLFLVIDEAVGIAHHRQVAVDAGDRPGDDVEMLGREQRHIDAGELAEFTRPLSRAIDHALAADLAFAVLAAIAHADDTAALDDDAAHRRAFDDARAAHAGTLGQRLGQVGRIRLAVAGYPDRAAQVVGAKQRIDLSRFAGRDEFEVDAEAFGARHLALQQLQPLRCPCDVETAALLPSGRKPGFLLKRRVELDTVAAHPRRVARRAKLADQARGVPGRAAGQLALLEQHDVAAAELGQVIGDRRAGDAAADDHDPRLRRNTRGHRRSPVPGAIEARRSGVVAVKASRPRCRPRRWLRLRRDASRILP